jgi:putative nucleotidyltransferase with HDIG domain
LKSGVSYLGMQTIKNLALTTETFRVFTPDPRVPVSVCEAIQQHSYAVAAIAGTLPVDSKSRDLTIVAALLHDVGRLALASKMPDVFSSILSLVRERKCEPFEAEQELLGTTHAEIGAYLLGLWGVPPLASEAIAHHHHPTRIPHSGFDLSIAVYVADLLAHELEAHPEDSTGAKLRESDRACLETLGLWGEYAKFRGLAKEVPN